MGRLRRVLLGLTLALAAGPAAGRAGNERSPGQGIVVMAHGGTPEWNAAVLEAVEPLRKSYPVEVAFGMADRESLQQAVAQLQSQGVREAAVVRLFVSGGSFLEQTEYFLGLRSQPPPFFLLHEAPSGGHGPHAGHGADPSTQPRFVDSRAHPLPPIDSAVRLNLSREGLYDSPAMGRVIEERVRGLSRQPQKEAVLILAHGEGSENDNDRWLTRLSELTEHIQAEGFAAVRVETLREDWHDKRQAAEARIREYVRSHQEQGRTVIVVPFRVFGFGPYRQVLEGLKYVADGKGLLPHPEVTRWIQAQAEACFERLRGPAVPPASSDPAAVLPEKRRDGGAPE